MIEVWLAYKKKVEKLFFIKYKRLVKLMKKSYLEYCDYIDTIYYKILRKFEHWDIMIDIFFKKVKIMLFEEETGKDINNKMILY